MSCFRSTIIIAILALTTISNNISSSNAFKATYNINNYRTAKFRTKSSLDAIGIFFGTSTGSTQEAADLISAEFGDGASEPIDIEEVESVANEFAKYDSLIVGTPTWNTGKIIDIVYTYDMYPFCFVSGVYSNKQSILIW